MSNIIFQNQTSILIKMGALSSVAIKNKSSDEIRLLEQKAIEKARIDKYLSKSFDKDFKKLVKIF